MRRKDNPLFPQGQRSWKEVTYDRDGPGNQLQSSVPSQVPVE